MAKQFDYYVDVRELEQPIGGVYKFVAKVPYVVENPGPNFKHIHPPLHEHWGKTKSEAEAKAKAEVEEWITKQQNDGYESHN